MKLVKPLVAAAGVENHGYVDPKTLSKEEKELVTQVNAGHEAEAKLAKVMHETIAEHPQYQSAEIDINSEKGSYLRLAVVEGVAVEDGKPTGEAIVSESVNGYMTEMMKSLNAIKEAALDESNAETDTAIADA